jgi:uncharacterized protein
MKKIISFLFLILVASSYILPVLAEQRYSSSIKIVAIDSQGNGVIGSLTVEIIPGTGRLLVDTTHVLTGFDMQDSEKIAIKVVKDKVGFDFSKYDVIFTVYAPNVDIADGPSAGAAVAIAIAAAIKGRKIPDSFAITGMIQENGSIGPVGGIFAKAEAAAKSGITMFLIPKGQSTTYRTVKQIKKLTLGGIIEITRQVPVNVADYAAENWGMRVIEVSDIQEAINYGTASSFFMGILGQAVGGFER